MKLLIISLSPISCPFLLLGVNILLSTLPVLQWFMITIHLNSYKIKTI